MMEEGQGGEQAADPHQQISIRHSLNESTGGVLAKQGCTVKHKNHHQVPGNNEDSEEEYDGDFKEAGGEDLGIAYLEQAEGSR